MVRQPSSVPTRGAGIVPWALLLVLLWVSTPSPVTAQHPHPDPSSGEETDTSAPPPPALTEPGEAAFAAIQEVVGELRAQPHTDWSRVDLEALRRHLIDMRRFTLEAEVVHRERVPGGLRVTVRGLGPEADASVRRAVRAHASMLRAETGWTVALEDDSGGITLEVTSDDAGEAERIRGLGYIGWMTTGAHHREHHWRIATGESPADPGR